MFGIELDGIKKLEIAFVSAVLLVAGYFVYVNWDAWGGRKIDMTVTSYVEQGRPPLINPKAPRTPDNEDVKRRTLITVFAGHDGKLKLVEFPDDPDKAGKLILRFEPDVRRTDFLRWKDPWEKLSQEKDLTRKALIGHAYALLYPDKPIPGVHRVLARADFDRDQWSANKKAAQDLVDRVTFLDGSMGDGAFESKAYQKVLAALEKYRATPDADPTKDVAAAKRANAVIDAGMAYLQKLEAAKIEAVVKFVDTVYGSLNDEQKKAVQGQAPKIDAVKFAAPRLGPQPMSETASL